MIFPKRTTFKFIDNGYKKSMVLIPGWATDYRIFGCLNLGYNYLVPVDFCPYTFEKELLSALKENNINKVSLFGWSLGGFLAAEFASRHKNFIDKLILLSIRKRYNRSELNAIKTRLKKNKKAFLRKFYIQCFFKKENMEDFGRNLFKTYSEELDSGYLMDSLGYFEDSRIEPRAIEDIKKIKIVHGAHDKIAPIEEALEIKNNLPHAKFISIEEAGHVPFLEGSWHRVFLRARGRERFYEWAPPPGVDPPIHRTFPCLSLAERPPLPAADEKEIIKRNFSRYARYYDNYSNIQDISALRLISKLDSDNFKSILDVGCGTGNYTRLLREKFPVAKIKAIDISGEMIEIAREKLQDKQIEFAIRDAEKIDSRDSFDLISSNVSFQWFVDLEKTLLSYKRLLKPGGAILFSTFGPLTFYELNNSLKELFKEEKEINSSRFLEKIRMTKIMKDLFEKVEIEEETFIEKHISLKGLLRKIKYSGIRGSGINGKSLWVSKRMDRLEKIYKEKFKEIVATYQLFICKGAKKETV